MWILLIVVVFILLGFKMLQIFFLRWIHQKKTDTHVYRFRYRLFKIEHPMFTHILPVFISTSIISIVAICVFRIHKNEENDATISDNENEIHTYKIIVEDITWYDAYQKCLNDNGHLLSLDSDAEYNYVINEIEKNGLNKYIFYVGAYRPENDSNYYWIDSNGYLKEKAINDIPYWMENEPSLKDLTLDIDENYSVFFYYHKEEKWVINDVPNNIIQAVPSYQNHVGYICEYE